MRLGVGSELKRVALDPKPPHRLASEAEVLERLPDLKSPGWEYELSLVKKNFATKSLAKVVGVKEQPKYGHGKTNSRDRLRHSDLQLLLLFLILPYTLDTSINRWAA